MADKKKQLVWNFIEFLKTSQQDGTVKEDDKESLDVAIQCMSEAFELDLESSQDSQQYSVKPASLLSIFDVALKTLNSKKAPAPSEKPAPSSEPTSSAERTPSGDDKTKAEFLKMEGNSAISSKSYSLAIQKYSDAIALNPTNPVYYSNRAAAYSAEGSHDKAVEDAQESLRRDPKFVRGYSRLGHAQYSLANYSASVDAYTRGLELDPNNATMKSSLAQAKLKLSEDEEAPVYDDSEDGDAEADALETTRGSGAGPGAGGMPDLSALAGMFGGGGGGGGGAGAGGMPDLSSLAGMFGGGGGGGGGMPDLASMMQNPMMMQMAQQMMANGGMEKLMANPNIRNMAERMQGGGGMPDLESLKNDPEMKNLAQQFMGGKK